MSQVEAIHTALSEGDYDAIAELRDAAYSTEPTLSDQMEDGELSPREQFDSDYAEAHAQYQADHEAPEEEREQYTRDAVEQENAAAPDPEVDE
jgi:hypothetical protein